jgi:prepilin-type N-terminal cleavage/methylation domain-containing protein
MQQQALFRHRSAGRPVRPVSGKPAGSRVAAFTLIELLVVIAIIAILAAILFPVFAQARAKARQAACLSNTKQIGNALMMYAQDYDETLPGYRFGESSTPQMNPYHADPNVGAQSDRNIFINQVLFPYTKNDDIWKCSSNPKAWVNVDNKNSLPAQDPAFKSYGGQNSFGANNYVFPSRRGFALAALAAPRTPWASWTRNTTTCSQGSAQRALRAERRPVGHGVRDHEFLSAVLEKHRQLVCLLPGLCGSHRGTGR